MQMQPLIRWGIVVLVFGGFVTTTTATATATAQLRSNAVAVVEQSTQPNVEVTLELRRPQSGTPMAEQNTRSQLRSVIDLRRGEYIEVCFSATRTGYISLWSIHPTQGHPVVVYPNPYSHPGQAVTSVALAANSVQCVGDQQDFRLRVDGDPDLAHRVYIQWTAQQGQQLTEADYPVLVRSVGSSVPYASTTIHYRVVP